MGEGLCTLGAGVRRQATVCPLVNLQVTIHGESLVTLEAGIRFLPGVNFHVSPQVVCPAKGFYAFRAGVWSFAIVDSLVCLQATGLGERFVTNCAGEELFSSMGQVV